MIPIHEVDFSVRPAHHGMRAVLAFAFKMFQKVHFAGLEAIVMVGVDEPVKAGAFGPWPFTYRLLCA